MTSKQPRIVKRLSDLPDTQHWVVLEDGEHGIEYHAYTNAKAWLKDLISRGHDKFNQTPYRTMVVTPTRPLLTVPLNVED